MIYTAKARYLRVSPRKIRAIVDMIRGKKATEAFNWLQQYPAKKGLCVFKVLKSAVCNAIDRTGVRDTDFLISVAKVDLGPCFKYMIPGSCGKSMPQRRRTSHVEIGVVALGGSTKQANLNHTEDKGVARGTKS